MLGYAKNARQIMLRIFNYILKVTKYMHEAWLLILSTCNDKEKLNITK